MVGGMSGGSIRALLLLAAAAGSLAAQSPNASPLIRGVLIARSLRPSGEFSVRTADDREFHYRFDAKTYVEREGRLADIPRLDIGEKVEVLSDEGAASAVRYARTVHVILPSFPHRPDRSGSAPDSEHHYFTPISTLSLAGVVMSSGRDWLVLHTREKGNETILLRRDTRFLDNGEIVDAGALHPNMRVFIRGGYNLYNETEAYQVIWGEILEPQ